MQERSLPAYIEWSFEFRTPQLLTHKKLWLLPNSKMPSEFRTSQLVSDKKNDFYLTWKAFRISVPSTALLLSERKNDDYII